MRKNNDLAKILEKLKIYNAPDLWDETWNESMRSFPGKNIEFLQDTFLLEANKMLNLPESALRALLNTAAVILEDMNLSRLAWHCNRLVFYGSKPVHPWSFYFPSLYEYLGEIASLFNGIILISGIRNVLRLHEERGIPENIIRDTFSDVKLWMEHYHAKHGRWGLGENQWHIYHFTGRLYRLERLQYVIDNFQGDIKVYRNIQSKEVIALSEPGIRFRNDGQVDGTNNVFDLGGYWVSQLEINGKHIRGNPVSPAGKAIQDCVTLPFNEWELMLSKEDTVLDIHIPGDDRIHEDLCRNSVNAANEFFPRHFSDKPYRAFTCNTWFFDSQYQKLLPPISNIVKFQREFYLFPVLAYDTQTLQCVFGEIPADISKAPRDTQLRRVILDHIASGGHLHNAGGFILKDDLDWGKAIYQGEKGFYSLDRHNDKERSPDVNGTECNAS